MLFDKYSLENSQYRGFLLHFVSIYPTLNEKIILKVFFT